ncbi:MAG: hypothetical protein L3J37_03100 [Rhodobacteraceae bacterium]|nr:hypothetical protein [Paracoccaceae bacterium]
MAVSRIAIIGWGSLIWDLEILAPHVVGGWQMQAGPRLPMEFSRISPKRKMGLAVCLDPVAGVACKTHIIRSARSDIGAAIEDLRSRERAPIARIGAFHQDFQHGRMPDVVEIMRAWCAANGWDGAVWTDLEPNFKAHTGHGFSVEAGIEYLKTLSGENLAEAHAYIENAPAQTTTPLRKRLARDEWWQGLGQSG